MLHRFTKNTVSIILIIIILALPFCSIFGLSGNTKAAGGESKLQFSYSDPTRDITVTEHMVLNYTEKPGFDIKRLTSELSDYYIWVNLTLYDDINDEDDLNRFLKDFPEKVIVIDFWAKWCAPCKIFASTFERAYREYSKDFIFAKVNVDENPKVAQYFGITSIPTTLFIKGGDALRKFVGVVNYKTLTQILEKFK